MNSVTQLQILFERPGKPFADFLADLDDRGNEGAHPTTDRLHDVRNDLENDCEHDFDEVDDLLTEAHECILPDKAVILIGH